MSSVSSHEDNVTERVYRLVQAYVLRKTETKSGTICSIPQFLPTVVTAFQYPFALNLIDCNLDDKGKTEAKTPDAKAYPTKGDQRKDWLRHLLRAIGELNGVAGNHARSYFEMAPASIVIRLTDCLVAGFETYGFKPDGAFPEIVDGILQGDYPAVNFILEDILSRACLITK